MNRRDRRRTTTGAVVASLLVHAVVLTWLARQAAPDLFSAAEMSAPDVVLQLAPAPYAEPPPLPAPRPAAPVPSSARHRPLPQLAAPAPRAPAPPAPAIQARPRPPVHSSVQAPPAPPSRMTANIPAAGGSNGAARPRQQSPWAVAPDDGQGDVRGVLRATVGCSHEDYLHLNEAERAACDRRLGREGREAVERIDALPAEARASFDAAVQARDRMRAAGTGPMGEPIAPCRSEGSGPEHSCLNLPPKHP